MRKLTVMALATAGLTMVTGCPIFITSDDDQAQFALDWSMIGASCESLGADGISVIATPTDGGLALDMKDYCVGSSGSFLSDNLPLGDYTLVMSILQGTSVLAASAPMSGSLVTNGDLILITVPPFDFTPPVHNITFTVDFGAGGGTNCDKVVQQQVFLSGVGSNECISLPLSFADGTPGSDTCGTAAVCMETTTTQTITGVADGTYVLSAFGLKGATDASTHTCYQGAVMFDVAGADANVGAVPVPFMPLAEDEEACNATKPAARR